MPLCDDSSNGQVVILNQGTQTKRGGQRFEWGRVEDPVMEEDDSFRAAAKEYVKTKDLIVKTLTSSSNKGEPTLIGHCDACKNCSQAYCFSVSVKATGQKRLLVETTGECGGERNNKRLKKENAKKYCKDAPAKAGLAMLGKVPEKEKPSDNQIKHYRHKLKEGQERYSAE